MYISLRAFKVLFITPMNSIGRCLDLRGFRLVKFRLAGSTVDENILFGL